MLNIFQLIAQPESSGNPYAYNPIPTSSGHAEGLYQITTGTWSDFAPRAGVDTSLYPTPNSAPQSIQQQVASVIPFGRWATSTQQYVASQLGFMPSGSQTLGQIQQQIDTGAAGDYVSNGGFTYNGTPYPYTDPLQSTYPSGIPSTTDAGTFPGLDNPLYNFGGGGQQTLGDVAGGYYTGSSAGVPISNLPNSVNEPGALNDTQIQQLALGGPSNVGSNVFSPFQGTGATSGTSFFATIENFMVRFGLVLAGIVLLGVAAWGAMKGEFGGTAKKAAKSVLGAA